MILIKVNHLQKTRQGCYEKNCIFIQQIDRLGQNNPIWEILAILTEAHTAK